MRRVIEVKDTDEMFMRNRNRSIQTWHKLDEMDRAATKPEKDGSDSEDEDNSPRKSKHKRKKREISAVPAWQMSQNLTRLLSHDLSSDSESDDGIEIVGTSSTPSGKRKRKQRSRSRSITPPPALPEYQVQAAKNVVRQTLNAAIPRAASPTYFDPDESTDTIVFQPELDALAHEIEINAQRESSQAPEVTDAQDHVVLTVHWHPHPLDLNSQKAEWQYRIDRSDQLRDLFDAAADDANILANNLVMTYQGKRVFPSVTPAFLKIYGDTAELAAYEKQAYDYIQKNPIFLQSNPTPASPVHHQVDHDDGTIEIQSDEEAENNDYVPQTQTQDSEAESEAEGETFKLILRSPDNKNITLTVRPTTKCGAIIKAFLKKLGVEEQYPEVFADGQAKPAAKKRGRPAKAKAAAPAATGTGKDPRLCIDGDKMDNATPIGDMDLEDGDMIDVVGL
ncbi:hypothetical protein BDN70DRAFT_891816 [Pholiota conissans]|uniref:Rad60/SUMO-like domain-containing protein n=1 Tax=Pholiota conissans TaxID=109636 RepID=A0A9P5ZA54_9AGAR|nr:hypothetical protein BDN70DRAFT_891816 [Pholiota conissans]